MTDNQKIDQHILSKYKIIKKLGAGAYGHVWKVSPHDKPNVQYALKKVFEAFQHNTDAQRTYRQISILKKLNHENVIKLHDILPSVSGRDIYLVFEYMNTDLYRTIYDHQLQDIHKKYILYQLLKGLMYLHSANILHRDLKPSNLLLSAQCQVKICDFGLARYKNGAEKENVMTEGVATRWYRAPQVLLGSNDYDEKADIWSVGCIFAQMLVKTPLFNCNSIVSHFEKIIQIVGRPTLEQISKIGETAACLLNQCGGIKQKSLKQSFASCCDENGLDLLSKLLKFDSEKRISARQALNHSYFKQFFKESELITFKGKIMMETDQNIKLSTEAYKNLIEKYFISPKEPQTPKVTAQPQRFSDLRRQKSFGKILEEINSRKSSCQKQNNSRKNNSWFEQIIKQRATSTSKSKNSRPSSIGSNISYRKLNDHDKENQNCNKGVNLQKFSQKQPGTFAALKKVHASKFNK